MVGVVHTFNIGGDRVERLLLVGTCIVALVVIGYNIKTLGNKENQQLKIIGSLLLGFTALRYITLIIYGVSYDLALLNSMRYFYYASSIGITLLTALAVWYAIPTIKERIQPIFYLCCFLPWILFYLYVIIKQPTQIVESKLFGYELVLISPFNRYLGIAQASFIVVIIGLCIIGILSYKHLQIRIELLMIILAQILLVIDGVSISKSMHHFFRLFTVTEAFALWTVYYVFSHPLKMIKRQTKNAS